MFTWRTEIGCRVCVGAGVGAGDGDGVCAWHAVNAKVVAITDPVVRKIERIASQVYETAGSDGVAPPVVTGVAVAECSGETRR